MTGPCQKTKLKTGDYIIVAVVLLCAALLSFGFAGKSTPRELTLSIGGETAATLTLESTVSGAGGMNGGMGGMMPDGMAPGDMGGGAGRGGMNGGMRRG